MDPHDIPENLEKMYDFQLAHGKAAEPERDRLVSLLSDCFEKFSSVYVLIDALDECANTEVVKILEDLQSLPPVKMRLYLTGRTHAFEIHEIRNNDQLQSWLKSATYQPIQASNDDIVKYLREELEKRAKGPQLADVRDQIVEKISSEANGQYHLDI